ncbi:uncharacterized protein LOC129735658 [Falco cherrug]|uniref:uncharacterized protein LOC129735658 n=1 Tax=Falco cherrug TaxID=345164 RepID=UPI00247B0423|nr:uncharacterized protein LOC129735658 [Falco cherrug]
MKGMSAPACSTVPELLDKTADNPKVPPRPETSSDGFEEEGGEKPCDNNTEKSLQEPRHRILSRPEAVAALVRKGRDRIVETDGTEPADISIPFRGDDYEWLLRHSTAIQEALMGYTGVVHNNRPKAPLWKMLEHYQWIARPLRSKRPAEGPTVFTDAGRKMKKAVRVWQSDNQWQKQVITAEPGDNLQTLELKAAVERANRTRKDYLQRQKVSQDTDGELWLDETYYKHLEEASCLLALLLAVDFSPMGCPLAVQHSRGETA